MKMSRLESSKEVRRVLNRYGVDLGQCQYSVAGREVLLTGWLCKTDGSDFGSQEISSMVNDFMTMIRGCSIRGDMENWSFSSDHITNVGKDENEDNTADQEVEVT